MGVVDALEVIHVCNHHSKRFTCLDGLFGDSVQLGHRVSAIVQSREWIADRRLKPVADLGPQLVAAFFAPQQRIYAEGHFGWLKAVRHQIICAHIQCLGPKGLIWMNLNHQHSAVPGAGIGF